MPSYQTKYFIAVDYLKRGNVKQNGINHVISQGAHSTPAILFLIRKMPY
jgi:hypothetical protein